MPINLHKKLRRLPHVFSQVLELPLRSHADVFIEDRPDCLQFTANIENRVFSGQVRAHAVKIYPGVTKVVVRERNGEGEAKLWLNELEVDVWRFRLPATTRPELDHGCYGHETYCYGTKGRGEPPRPACICTVNVVHACRR